MIPLKDRNPSRTIPIVTVAIIILNVVAFLFELSQGPRQLRGFLVTYGVVPAYLAGIKAPPPYVGYSGFISVFTSMFLHGGWFHLIGNMWFLWIFGDNVEDRLGHFRFVLFYLFCGIGATIAHTIFNLNSELPAMGASGAIAGVLGAYLVTFPGARVVTLVPIFFFLQIMELPAVLVIGLWFLSQLLNGTAALVDSKHLSGGGVAWWAHIGGFIAGIILMKVMQPRQRSGIGEWLDR